MDTLQTLLAAVRPYKPFSFTIEGASFNLFARKASYGELQDINSAWDKAYQESKGKFSETDTERSNTFDQLKRSSTARLAKFIADAMRPDLLSEASSLCDDKPTDDPEVVALADKMVDEKEAEYATLDKESLIRLAMDRRGHYAAVNAANEAMSRKMAATVIYQEANGEKTPLFPNAEAVLALPIDVVGKLVAAASDTLAPEKDEDAPLFSAASQQSSEPSPSSAPSAADQAPSENS